MSTIASEEFALTQDEKVLRCLERLVMVAYSRSVRIAIEIDRERRSVGIEYGPQGEATSILLKTSNPVTPTLITDIINRIYAIERKVAVQGEVQR